MHCHRFVDPALSRRDMLVRCANGFGGLALTALLREEAFGGAVAAAPGTRPDSSGPRPHEVPPQPDGAPAEPYPARARASFSCYMDGGPSQVDTFDPKPRLTASMASRSRSRRSRPSSTTWATSSAVPGSSGITARAGSRSATCSRTSAAAWTSWRSSAPWSPISPSTRPPTTSCTPAAGSRDGPSEGAWVDLWAGQRIAGPARLRRPQWRPDPARGDGLFQQRLPARGLPGFALQARLRAGREHHAHRTHGRTPTAEARACSDRSTEGVLGRIGHHDNIEAAIIQL